MTTRGASLLLGVMVIAAAGALAVFVTGTRRPPPFAESPAPGLPERAAVAVPAPLPDVIPLILAAAPELTAESAKVLHESQPGFNPEMLARVSLLQGIGGFPHMEPRDLQELNGLFARVYARMGAQERQDVESYLQGLRAGRSGTAEQEVRARGLLNTGIQGLSGEAQARLQALFTSALIANRAYRDAGAAAVARQAARPPIPVADAFPTPTGASPSHDARLRWAPPGATSRRASPAGDIDAGASREEATRLEKEQYWRGRWVVARGRRDVAKRNYETVNKMWLAHGESYVDKRGRTVVSDAEELQRLAAEAKAAWQAAEKAFVDLEDEGRRAGALPGWFR